MEKIDHKMVLVANFTKKFVFNFIFFEGGGVNLNQYFLDDRPCTNLYLSVFRDS